MLRAVHVCCFLGALYCGAIGCRSEEGIRSYSVPKELSGGKSVKPQAGEATDRMLVAVVPHGAEATFFKLTGPIGQVEPVVADMKKFIESLQLAGDEPPTWTLPAGWREAAGNEFRRATIVVPAGDSTLELAVTQFSWQSSDAYLRENINRWRGQMELPPVGLEQLEESHESIKLGDTQAIWLDLKGRSSGGGMAPFAAGRGTSQAVPEVATTSAELPFDQKTPEGWQPRPATGPRRAAFQVGEGAGAAEATVFDFSTEKPQMASPLTNVDRWRGEIGLPPTNESEVAKLAEKVTISGKDGIFVAMESPAGHEPLEATLAAMSEWGGQVWFFKLKGPRDTVMAERERFIEWLKSIQFRE